MSWEYKCVGAPERPKRQRGVRGRSERVALAMQETIAAEAVDGWEYLRTDLLPVEEKNGFFSRTHEVHRAVLVFRRALPAAAPASAGGRLGPAREPLADSEPVAEREPEPEPGRASPELRVRDERPDHGERREGRMPLSAERDEPPRPPRRSRPPSGLG